MTTTGPIVTMPDGLPGFEQCRRFIVVTSETLQPFTCLQSLDEPRPSFLALDPRQIVPDYAASLGDGDRARLEASDGDALLWLAFVCVDSEQATVNLRAPVTINARTMRGIQVIPSDSTYSTNHPLPLD
ncbi:MAG TPA: flagellar assembly protein FliW [Vicinamibacterales bacterium]|nr:flagellar assembly protein FliW [Vicinamibacterales bacterium]